MIRCARRRVVVIAPGISDQVAQAIVETWRDLGPNRVQVVVDVDPEVCRMGYGQLSAFQRLNEEAERLGAQIHQQPGLRIGVVITDESTIVYAPTPLLVEAGGKELAKPNALRIDAPLGTSDLLGLAREPKAQKLLHSSFQLIEEGSVLSGEKVTKLKKFIAQRFLINLPGYGNVILRSEKEEFDVAIATLEKYIERFQRHAKKTLQGAIDKNRQVLTEALLPSVEANPPTRWKRFLGPRPDRDQIARLLDRELTDAFGSVDDLVANMSLTIVFKGVTYESLSDPDFLRTARRAIPSFLELHTEYDAVPEKSPQERLKM